MSRWFLAPALVELRDEIDARWPKRDKASDGSIGDERHSHEDSDHNPDARGCVHAIDVTNDPQHGPAGKLLAAMLVAHAKAGDDRCWYVIWDRRIWSRTHGWRPQLYAGPDPHTNHVHISLMYNRAIENDRSRWLSNPAPAPKPKPKPTPVPRPVTDQEEPMIAYRTNANPHAFELSGGALVFMSAERTAAIRASGTPLHIVKVHQVDPVWQLPKIGRPAAAKKAPAK